VSGRSNHRIGQVALVVALLATHAVSAGGAPTRHRVSSFRASGRAVVEPMIRAKPDDVSQPSGAEPARIESAYGLDTSPYAGAGQTIAIVDSYDDPNIALDVYMTSAYWALPPCGTSCFTKVDQNGGPTTRHQLRPGGRSRPPWVSNGRTPWLPTPTSCW
jgi:hypothetical protein